MKRQQTREIIAILMFILFPVIYYYFSPYLIIMGASEGIVTGSLLVFAGLFFSSLFAGRVFCGWICPAGATQELCAMVRKKGFKNGKKNLIKYAIWAPWISIIALMFFEAGGIKAVDPLYQTYYGISISDIYSVVIFVAIAGLVAGFALAAGKRAFCHTLCWMAPFMIIGRKIRNTANLSSLQLSVDKEKCVNCKVCNQKCPMSLNVNSMVQQNTMENTECILCGSCVDNCPKQVLKYSFGKNKPGASVKEQRISN
ncbi:MAG TPA: 4Fe-4S binding protein [Candidatus Nanoarchaeia archaeon]|nr:4Fe-4S binding protein [Candidatus Nanoarchaeia archaeon]